MPPRAAAAAAAPSYHVWAASRSFGSAAPAVRRKPIQEGAAAARMACVLAAVVALHSDLLRESEGGAVRIRGPRPMLVWLHQPA